MRKRTAWIYCIFAISTTLMMVGYVAWCGRSFYLEAAALDTTGFPPEVAATAPRLVEELGMRKPYDFERHDLLVYLKSPHKSLGRKEIFSYRTDFYGPDLIFISGIGSYSSIIYSQKSGKWEVLSEQEKGDILYRNRKYE